MPGPREWSGPDPDPASIGPLRIAVWPAPRKLPGAAGGTLSKVRLFTPCTLRPPKWVHQRAVLLRRAGPPFFGEGTVGVKSRDFDDAEALRERNRKLRAGLEECRALLKRTHELLETARRVDVSAND